ncbi:MAG TPA: T9SS type A sorting domain-containing protein [Ignavibacteriaceae bacterium]|nr:T9SS type A sorting domain-containing protein [Ignavibacteriaceae bacterium]HRQ53577.1 T9SS type A sorting domain-containing protein [Ignavibacteriaceae bacterium]
MNIILDDNLLSGELFDDGMHQDKEAGDDIFANVFDLPRVANYDSYLIQVNNLKIPINDHGVIAATLTNFNLDGEIECIDNMNNSIHDKESFLISTSRAGGIFDSVTFLFSSGFMMSGLDGNSIWVNAVASAFLVEDYISGNVGSDPKDKKNSIYVVRADDLPFGRSWQAWKDAVTRGAEFYDGDNDGVYNPIDKNFNGIWDKDEDMPMVLGDETVWCVYNDGVPDSLRRWRSSPKDIEVAQTVFASSKPGLENVMFLRYKITNKRNVDYDSVYFGFWADADLGDATDDLVGCDTVLNSGFVYNDGSDNWYDYFGEAPPSFYTTLLQGPIIETNSTVDTAYLNLGEILGTKKIPNLKNLNTTSQIIYIGGDPSLNEPNIVIQARNYLMGKNKFGIYLDPCTWPYGHVFGGVDCNQVDKHFWFSGDPVNQIGWIDTTPSDHRNLLSTGPFNLKSNDPVDIIAAYVVGRGTDALNSITVTRGIVEGVLEEYKNNFSRLTYKSGLPTNPVVSYELYQNYPNPFNPTTTIRYALPQDGIVTIKIFDILGQQVATLKNEFQKANRYEVKFDSKGLASGVYIYKIQVNNFIESKKMILLK